MSLSTPDTDPDLEFPKKRSVMEIINEYYEMNKMQTKTLQEQKYMYDYFKCNDYKNEAYLTELQMINGEPIEIEQLGIIGYNFNYDYLNRNINDKTNIFTISDEVTYDLSIKSKTELIIFMSFMTLLMLIIISCIAVLLVGAY